MSERNACTRLRVVSRNMAAEVIVQTMTAAGAVSEPPPESHDFEAGFLAGQTQARATCEAVIQDLKSVNRQLAEAVPAALARHLANLEQQARGELVELALALTAQLTRRVVHPEELIRGALAELLPQLLAPQDVRVVVAPDCLPALQAAGDNGWSGLTLVAREGLAPGDVLMETTHQGVFEGTLSSRLANLGDRLRERLQASGTDAPSAALASETRSRHHA